MSLTRSLHIAKGTQALYLHVRDGDGSVDRTCRLGVRIDFRQLQVRQRTRAKLVRISLEIVGASTIDIDNHACVYRAHTLREPTVEIAGSSCGPARGNACPQVDATGLDSHDRANSRCNVGERRDAIGRLSRHPRGDEHQRNIEHLAVV